MPNDSRQTGSIVDTLPSIGGARILERGETLSLRCRCGRAFSVGRREAVRAHTEGGALACVVCRANRSERTRRRHAR